MAKVSQSRTVDAVKWVNMEPEWAEEIHCLPVRQSQIIGEDEDGDFLIAGNDHLLDARCWCDPQRQQESGWPLFIHRMVQ